MLICRYCKRSLALTTGCEICQGDRTVLRRTLGDVFAEEDTLYSAMGKAVELIALNLERLEEEMKQLSPDGSDLQRLGVNDKHVRMITDLSKALSTASTQARALDKERDARAKNMSMDGKMDVLVEFFARQTLERQDRMVPLLRKEYKGSKWVR